MNELTTAQKLRPVKLALGKPIQLRPYEQVLKVTVTDDKISLVISTYEYTETTREVRFHKSGIKMRNWKLKDGRWVEQFIKGEDGKKHSIVLWDDDFKPYIECRFGHSLTPEEYHDRLEREAMTYRVGTPRTPMDNFQSTVYASPHETTPAMYRYWTGHARELGYTTESDELGEI